MILREKTKFERKVAKSYNKRAFSHYVKSKNKCKEGIGPLSENGNLVHDDGQMCTILNNYFISVFTRDTSGSVTNYSDKNDGHVISNLKYTPAEVLKTIETMHN